MPRRGGDVVAIACIIAAQRPVGALDDPLGAFDDPVERRAQHLVERIVEGCGCAPVRRPQALRRTEPNRGSRRSFRRRRSRLRRSSTTARLSSARLRARWPVKPRRAASALISGISPASSSSRRRTRVSGWPATSSGSTPSSSARSGDSEMMPQAPRRPPIRCGLRRFPPPRRRRGLRRAAARPERARSSPRATSAISSPSGVAWTHSSMS